MKLPGLHNALAVALPLALGLGLIYLYIMGGMDASSVVLALVGMVMLVPAVGVLADIAADERRRVSEARDRRSWRRRREREADAA